MQLCRHHGSNLKISQRKKIDSVRHSPPFVVSLLIAQSFLSQALTFNRPLMDVTMSYFAYLCLYHCVKVFLLGLPGLLIEKLSVEQR